MSEETGRTRDEQQLAPTQTEEKTGQDIEKPAITQSLKRVVLNITWLSFFMTPFLWLLFLVKK